MRLILAAVMISFALGGAASAQASDPPPAACRQDANGAANWQACYDATRPGSPWRVLAGINLGSQAYLRNDYAAAVRFYDEARPPNGQQIYSDVSFHALRGAAYDHVGRADEARADASIAFRMLHRDPTIPASPSDYLPAGIDRETIYNLILPILKNGDQAQFQTALTEFRALPATDWISYANRSAVLSEIGDFPGALQMSTQALGLAPNEPSVLNNHCYILLQSHRAADALSFCQRALAQAPDVPQVRESMAQVLAALGRCTEAEREMAEARRLDPTSPGYREALTCTPH